MANRRAAKNEKNNRYIIPGQKNGDKHIEVDLGANDTGAYVVVVKDLDPNLATAYSFIEGGKPQTINIKWLTAFGVSMSNAKNLDQYASIKYSVELDTIPQGSRLFLYYNDQINEQSYTVTGNRIRFELALGDPPIGFGP